MRKTLEEKYFPQNYVTCKYRKKKLLNTFVKNKAIQLRRAAMIIADQAPESW